MEEGKTIRLSIAAREFNVGVTTIIEYLTKKGVKIDPNPNSKLTSDIYSLLVKEYQRDRVIKQVPEKKSLDISHRQSISIDEKKIFVHEEEESVREDILIKSKKENDLLFYQNEALKRDDYSLIQNIDFEKKRKNDENSLIEDHLKRKYTYKYTLELGWNFNTSINGDILDLDISAFILGENKKILNYDNFIFYNNLVSPDGAIYYAGDERSEFDSGVRKSMKIDLSKINHTAKELYFVITIYDSEKSHYNFGKFCNSFVRIYNSETKEEILKYELEEDFSIETGVEFGRLYKKTSEWVFEAIGIGQKAGLKEYFYKFN